MDGPGPQQPSSPHILSQVLFCCSEEHTRAFVWLYELCDLTWPKLLANKLHKAQNIWIQSRTTAVHCCIVSSSYALVHWSEQLRPVAAFDVTEAGVVPDHHIAITDLLQRTQAEIIQVRYVQSCKTDAATTFTREVKTETLFKGEKYLFFHDKNRFNMQRQKIICKLTKLTVV